MTEARRCVCHHGARAVEGARPAGLLPCPTRTKAHRFCGSLQNVGTAVGALRPLAPARAGTNRVGKTAHSVPACAREWRRRESNPHARRLPCCLTTLYRLCANMCAKINFGKQGYGSITPPPRADRSRTFCGVRGGVLPSTGTSTRALQTQLTRFPMKRGRFSFSCSVSLLDVFLKTPPEFPVPADLRLAVPLRQRNKFLDGTCRDWCPDHRLKGVVTTKPDGWIRFQPLV